MDRANLRANYIDPLDFILSPARERKE